MTAWDDLLIHRHARDAKSWQDTPYMAAATTAFQASNQTRWAEMSAGPQQCMFQHQPTASRICQQMQQVGDRMVCAHPRLKNS